MGSMNYFQSGHGGGVVIVILALISLVLVFLRAYRFLWFTGLASSGILTYVAVVFATAKSKALEDLESEMSDNPFLGIGKVAFNSMQLEWGWAVMFLGAILLLATATATYWSAGKLKQLGGEILVQLFWFWKSKRNTIITLAAILILACASLVGYVLYAEWQDEIESLRVKKGEEQRNQIRQAIQTQQERREQLEREKEEASRLEQFRLAQEAQARFEADMEAEQERQAVEEARRREEVSAARAAEEARARERAAEVRRKWQEERLLEKERQEAEAKRLKEEHHQQISNWHNRFYSPSMASFKQALAKFYDSYRAEDASVSLAEACRELKLQAVSVRKNNNAMTSPDRDINLNLREMLAAFDATAVACTNGRLTDMLSKLASAEKAVARLAQSLKPYSLAP